jgi:hypothetical protein
MAGGNPMVQQVAVRDEQVILGGRDGALVASHSQPGVWHVVRSGACDCLGYQHRQTCRHIGAAQDARAAQALCIVSPIFSLVERTPAGGRAR